MKEFIFWGLIALTATHFGGGWFAIAAIVVIDLYFKPWKTAAALSEPGHQLNKDLPPSQRL